MPQLQPKLGLSAHLMAFALFLLAFPGVSLARHLNQVCGSVFCGNLNISYPLRLKNHACQFGYYSLELECENNNRTTLVPRQGEGKFSVQEIIYESCTMRVVDAGMDMDDCSSLPLNSAYDLSTINYQYQMYSPCPGSIVHVLNCSKPIKSSVYVEASRCTTKSNTSSYFYFLDESTPASDFNQSCTVVAEIPISVQNISGMSTLDIYNKLSEGVWLSWTPCDYQSWYYKNEVPQYVPVPSRNSFQTRLLQDARYGLEVYFGCVFNFYDKDVCYYSVGITVGVVTLRTLVGILCLLVVVADKWERRHLSVDDKIEEFLQNNNLAPIRYSSKEIKKMTRNFREKLGEGGYGSVFKGKLRSGRQVAVKVLGKSKGDGQDFMNEVASIGRIHHANVAKLVGFCVEGSKQALVYDFMSNGSLDKIIFVEENKNILGWKKMFDIVLGVARGINYLHRGCDIQILHFDIKPHNILLDENFNPKVSDFGLAKLYSIDDSVVSLTAARGTIGYIAPELVYKNLRGISYKADVYSFGMLLMEMVGRRKNVNAFADHTSRIYFPSWIYNRLDQGEDMELGDVSEDEKVMVRKMIIIAFWCIQLHPTDRPSMSNVLKMLESDVELLKMPPKPFHQLSLDTSSEVHGRKNTNDEASTSPDAITIIGPEAD